ncbi:MAG: YkgJ family cysteine cluster protein [Deltaproteobacteria bacterium]|nr:YkgJ family cysteine cluster protein [Deltaproteobacteria bacterium]
MTPYSKFRFSCSRDVACFTRCCKDVNIFLTPYDVLRMKGSLGITSGEFLKRYTKTLLSGGSSLPVVLLRLDDDNDKSCLFLTPGGCRIYADRPWSCRMYPLDRASDEDDEFTLIVDGTFCFGLNEKKEWVVEDWFIDQGLVDYDTMNQSFVDVAGAEHTWKDRVPGRSVIDMFYMTCYDIDRFRDFVFTSDFLNLFEVDPLIKGLIAKDDLELLKFGFKWLRFGLFGDRTMTVKKEALESKRRGKQRP